METRISEIADGIYRLSTFVGEIAPPAGFTFNQFLVLGDEPLLFHTGLRRMFPLVRDAVARRFPGLGFERQRKINATDFYHTTLRREGRAAWDSVKHGAQLEALGVIDAAAVTALVDKLVTGPRTRESYRIWTVLNLASWASRSGSVNRRGA